MSRAREGLFEFAIAIALLASVMAIVSPYVHQELPTLRAVDGRGWSPDEGTVLHNADRLRQGDVLYADYFDFKGPIGFLPFTLAFMVDRPGIATGRIAMFVVLGLLAGTTYVAVSRVSRKRWLGLLFAGSIPFVAWPCWPFAYQDLLGSAFVIGAVPLLLLEPRRASLVLGGCMLGLALWTTISHGAPATLALVVTVAFRSWLTGTFSDVGRTLAWLLVGFCAVATPVFAWFALQGALDDLLWANFVFPFRYYMAPINVVAYGFDGSGYVAAWSSKNALDGALARIVIAGALMIPKLALSIAAVVAAGLIALGVRRARHGDIGRRGSAPALLEMAIPAALGSVALPVVFGFTRADLAHIGLVLPESAVAVSALLVPLRSSGTPEAIRSVLRRILAAATLILIGAGAWFHVRQVSLPYDRTDPDRQARAALGLHRLDRWTRPGDAIISPVYGGYTFLLSGRRNASRFATLWKDYAAYQWTVTADDIVVRRPKVLRANAAHVQRLTKLRPELSALYVRVGHLYVRADLARKK